MSGVVERAPRYRLHFPVRYRVQAEGPWGQARTLNVSRSGVLLQTAAELPVGEPLEMCLFLKAGKGPALLAQVFCSGHVVRATAQPSGRWQVGAKIADYQFVPRGREPDA
jgi:hypothetical protein